MRHPTFAGQVAAAVLLALVLAPPVLWAEAGKYPKPDFNEKGELMRPDLRFREWVYIGTPLTPNDMNPPEAGFPEFHNVYIHPDDFAHWKRTGEFADGTILIKELVSVGSKRATSGNGYFMGEFIGLEATVKDSERFPDESGHWAYFSFGHEYPLADSTAPFPAGACSACHQAAAADDHVFTQYYPVLRAAKGGWKEESSGVAMTGGSPAYEAIADTMTAAMGSATVPTADTPSAGGGQVPIDTLFGFLRSGGYKSFAQESGTHPSAGPHMKAGQPVRVFLDPLLDASLAAGNTSHPRGAAAIKEMYDENGELQGWAVMVKTEQDSAQGRGWYWYEITSTTDGSNPVAAGNGVPLCFGCHFTGRDFVVTEYPLQ